MCPNELETNIAASCTAPSSALAPNGRAFAPSGKVETTSLKMHEKQQQRKLYKADENPPLLLTFLFGFQQVMVSVSVLVSIPFLISDEVCPGRDRDQLRVRLIAATFVTCGIGTILQTAFGMRLALLQGVAFAYIPSIKAFMSMEEFRCHATVDDFVPPALYENKMAIIQGTLMASSGITFLIGATGMFISPLTVSSLLMLLMLLALLQGVAFAYIPSIKAFMSMEEFRCHATVDDFVPPALYENKMAIIQGTLMASSGITFLIGATGMVGKMTKFISPLTVSSLLMLLMLSSVKITVERMEKHWISLVMAAALFATVLYLARVRVPFPGFSKGRFRWIRFNLFGQFPYLTAILFSWSLCWLMTVLELIPEDSVARTDKNATELAIQNAPWARFPFPGQFGPPKFNIGLFVGFLVSAQTTLFEAVGNYHAVASISEERPPPSHAINRGIMAEGLGCFISGLIGSGVGITTHAENVGVVGITRVASRVTMLFGGLTMIAFGVVTKLGAVLSAIPDPLVGVILATSMAMVGGVAIANVQSVDLHNTRNVAILGFSIMMGMVVPEFYSRNSDVVRTGYATLDQVLKVLLNLPMFVGAFAACVMDNSVGGATRAQRGLRERGAVWERAADGRDVYAFPGPIQRIFSAIPIVRSLPFIPRQKTKKTKAPIIGEHLENSV
uniref:Solute carrier family 23 member 2 n=1 Tax=Globodera pallida TaxID=36090 RepID=A0A183C233_GLOPA